MKSVVTSSMRINLEMIVSDPTLLQLSLSRHAERYRETVREDPVFGYYTFRFNDYSDKFVTHTYMSIVPQFIFVTAAEEKIELAVQDVIRLNEHLKFSKEAVLAYANNDFECGRVTVKLEVIL